MVFALSKCVQIFIQGFRLLNTPDNSSMKEYTISRDNVLYITTI